ncbi:uncharacterized protein [Diadema setosum]|uniref:uncharacterized protein n=1 Tax=Diadema setosum TaxID=31175 RepID=UPI003B3B4EAD
MGQGVSKRHTSRQYQFGGHGATPASGGGGGRGGRGNRSRFHRSKKQHPQHQQLAQHSRQLQQQEAENAQMRNVLSSRYQPRRASQDYLSFMLEENGGLMGGEIEGVPERSGVRFNPVAIAEPRSQRQRSKAQYDVLRASRRGRSYIARNEQEEVTGTGYFSLEREDQHAMLKDATFAPVSLRRDRSEVSEEEIKKLAEELRASEWTRLGGHLGVPQTKMAALKENHHGDAQSCATEMLLLWKHNCSELANPRSHLALALSTVGREDLYGKIKRKVYHSEPNLLTSVNIPRDGDVTITTDNDDNPDPYRTLERTESGVETNASLTDSDEDADEEEEHRLQTSTGPEATTTSTVQPQPNIKEDPAYESIAAMGISWDVGRGKGETNPSTPRKTVKIEDTKSREGALHLTQPLPGQDEITSQASSREVDALPSHDAKDASTARKTVSIDLSSSDEEKASKPFPIYAKVKKFRKVPKAGGQPSVTQKTTKENRTSGQHSMTEVTDAELLMLAGDIRSTSEWRMLGKRLGVTQSHIQKLAATHVGDVTQCAYGILQQWKQQIDHPSRQRQVLASVMSDVGRDDLYTAIMKNKLSSRISSLEENINRWKEHLKDRYLSSDFEPCAIPGSSESLSGDRAKFIDVELVKLDESGEETKLLNRHGIIRLKKGRKQKSMIVLHGDAGSGKTSLLKQLAQDWALSNSESSLSQAALVLMLDLQEMRTCGSVGQGATRFLLQKDTMTTADMIDDFLKLYPERAVLLLDGYDLSHSSGDDVRLVQRIREQSQCHVVLTSRGRPSEEVILDWSITSIEIQDLNDDQRNAYMQLFFELNPTRKSDLQEYLKQDDILSCFCSRPMFLGLTCFLWSQQVRLHRVNTLSDLLLTYTALAFQDIKNEEYAEIDGETSQATTGILRALGRCALEGLIHATDRRFLFKTNELSHVEEEAENATRAGLLVGSPPIDSNSGDTSPLPEGKQDRSWRFFHTLMQEKCAGMYLADLQSSDVSKFESALASIRSVREAEALQYVLMFACGESLEAARMILKHLGDLCWKTEDHGALTLCQEIVLKCNFECHRGDALNRELQFILRSLQVSAFKGNLLADVTLRYFIMSSVTSSESPLQLQRVCFKLENRSDMAYVTACLQRGYFLLVPEFEFKMPKEFSLSRDVARRLSDDVISPNLRRLKVFSVFSSSDFVSNLLHSEFLEELVGTEIDPKYIDVPSWCRRYPNLTSLQLSCIMYQDPLYLVDHRKSLEGLGKELSKLTKLTRLSLSNFYGSEIMIRVLTTVLPELPNLAEVEIGPSGEGLEHYSDEIEEACGSVTDDTIQVFIKAIKKTSSLRTLKLSCYGNFEKLYQLMRAESKTRARRPSGM